MGAARQVDDAGADFASYARARWSALVRSLELHGVAAEAARRAVTVALARCEPQWRELRERHDVDDVVWGEAFGAAGLHVDAARLRALRDREEWRGLADDGSAVDLLAVRLETRAQQRRRRRLLVRGLAVGTAVLAVAVVVAVAVASLVTARGPATGLERLEVEERPNRLGLVWRDEDRIHLLDGVVEVPDAGGVVGALRGAVYGDRSGRVVVLEEDGERHVIGHLAPGASLVGWAAAGVVAWVDPRAEVDVLRVHDVRTRRAVAAAEVPAGTEPVALVAGELLFRTPGGSWSWQLPGGEPVPHPGPLAAAYSGDGRLALTFDEEGPANASRGRLVVVNRGTGAEVASGVAPDAWVVDVAFAPDSSVVYLTRPLGDGPAAGEYLRLSWGGATLVSRCQVDADVFEGRLHGTQCRRVGHTQSAVGLPDLLG